MSLLAYLVPQKLDKEPAATQALAYILRSSKLAAEFVRRLGLDFDFDFGHIESERRCEGGQPDLTISDSDGRHRIFIENKFWADLTVKQPVQYLGALPDDLPSALVFIVPEQRIRTVSEELKRLSRDAYELGNESTADTMGQLQMGTRTMCVTSWRHVLDLLKQISPNDYAKSDVLQLGGLVGVDDTDGFAPLCGEEFKQVSMPKRTLEYCKFVQPIIEELKSRNVVRDDIRLTHDWDGIGRHFCLFDGSELGLGVVLEPWGMTGITPLWLEIYPRDSKLGKDYHRLEVCFEDVQKGEDSKGFPRKYIPIRLRTGADRDEVIRDAANQVQCKLERLGKVTKATRQTGETA